MDILARFGYDWPERQVMTRHVPISEFKDHASELVSAAENGEEIVITRHGKPTVRLEVIGTDDGRAERRRRARAAMEHLLAHRQEMRAQGQTATIDELIAWKNEGRR
jgi:antitoxin (DNA-binding transcriptional repressor) of toxin-antitoxin stability system